MHAARLATYLEAGVESIEAMLYKQLLAAVGKEVTPVDFANYMVSSCWMRAVMDVMADMVWFATRSNTITASCSPTATSPRRSATPCAVPITVRVL